MPEIVLKPMWKKELAALCQCTAWELNKRLQATAKTLKWKESEWKGRVQLQKNTVRQFLEHNDFLPEKINI